MIIVLMHAALACSKQTRLAAASRDGLPASAGSHCPTAPRRKVRRRDAVVHVSCGLVTFCHDHFPTPHKGMLLETESLSP